MAKYLIKKVEFCEACKGKGNVEHPAWEEYWKENAEKQVEMTQEDDAKWFYEHGWYDDLYVNTKGIPSEEIPCYECKGEGTITSECDILEAVPELRSALKGYGSW